MLVFLGKAIHTYKKGVKPDKERRSTKRRSCYGVCSFTYTYGIQLA
ncbi:hypothetical protein SAMN05216352_102414 [Alteribacillus bidgolensis]|uniref:Uncharacterized protein n=1 Tax=Alteribacillus bidgolensis TaxID=930129 RepID=A0A1G8EWR9_9BACI|nr:hypothetical protein SAMN05216352_102414 [Alteribacillus bidgolensis]